MDERQIFDSIARAACQKIEEEISGLIGISFELSEPQIELEQRDHFLSTIEGTQVSTKLILTGDNSSGSGFLLAGVKDAIQLGGMLIMLPPDELKESISKQLYDDETKDSYGEIGNIVSTAYTDQFKTQSSLPFLLETKEQEIVEFPLSDTKNSSIADKIYYRVTTSMTLQDKKMGELSLLLPAATLGLADDEEEAVEDGTPNSITNAGHGSLDDTKNARDNVDSLLEIFRAKVQEQISDIVGAKTSCSEMKNMIVSKEQFFLDETKGKQVATTLEVSGDIEQNCYLYLGLKDVITIASTLLMLPDEEKEQALADNQFSPDIEEAFGEIGAVIAEVISEVFEEHYSKHFTFTPGNLETITPMKVDLESDEPIPDQTYYVNRLKLHLEGDDNGWLQLLFPAPMLGLESLEPEPSDAFTQNEQHRADHRDTDHPADAEMEEDSADTTTSSTPQSRNVLVISDETAEASRISDILRAHGMSVVLLNSRDNLHDYLNGSLTAVLLVMSDVDEQFLGLAIKISSGCSVPIIATGANWTRSKVLKALKYGIQDILPAPVTEEDIRQKISNRATSAQ